jgi:hypothetical protein
VATFFSTLQELFTHESRAGSCLAKDLANREVQIGAWPNATAGNPNGIE